jgi:hypothetical protein
MANKNEEATSNTLLAAILVWIDYERDSYFERWSTTVHTALFSCSISGT